MQAMLLRREWIHGQGYTFILSKLASPTDQSGGGTLILSSTAREKKSSSSKEATEQSPILKLFTACKKINQLNARYVPAGLSRRAGEINSCLSRLRSNRIDGCGKRWIDLIRINDSSRRADQLLLSGDESRSYAPGLISRGRP